MSAIGILCCGKLLHKQSKELFSNYFEKTQKLKPLLWELDMGDNSSIDLLLEKKISQINNLNQYTIYLLHEDSKQLSSVELAQKLKDQFNQAKKVLFIIGPYNGFSHALKKTYPNHLSLSKLTFPHQLVPVILMEQLYRAETIIDGRPYHY
jgi:23S rRNA (pseudouridine1915-N3)-methyltransferase